MTSINHTSADTGEQGTSDWRQYRAGSVTGSGFSDVLMKLKSGAESKVKQTYRMQLLAERITGLPAPEIYAPALAWGKENEDIARTAYEMYMAKQGTPVFVKQAGFIQHKTLDWVGVSVDGLVGEHGIIEIKNPWNTANHLLTIINASKVLAAALLNAQDDPLVPVPPEHLPQIQGNLWVTERDFCDFISFDVRVPEHLQLYVARVYRDEAYIKNLETEVVKFLNEIEGNVGALLLPEETFPAKKEATE